MSAAQDYYDQILGMGHSPENALAYTRQHYPNFVPGVAEAVAPPVLAPVSQQAVPAVQPVAQPVIAAAPAMAAPVAAVAPIEAPAAAQPNAYAPMAATPLPTGGTTPMMWGAVACIVFALLLSMAGQFSHAWIVNNEEGGEGQTVGLTTIRQDCSLTEPETGQTKQEAIDACKAFTYMFFAEDMDAATAELDDVEDIDDAIVGDHEDYCDNVYTFAAPLMMGDQEALANLSEVRDTCLETPAAGSTGGMVLWVGSIGALFGTVMLSAGSIGRTLPSNAEQHGKWAGMGAGVLMLLAVLVWWLLLPDTDTDTSAGMGVWMTVLGGVLGVVAGILAFLDQK
ncbi:MAG TPA: hypothetical protein D7H91_03545 [Candidatus Poseidoniales archaeon]|nr:MAG TPA: hypothetical protein D7H91_03545 [Candidatus Poseidoniales archaeon]HII78092.1 hypothetical protein [Poseidonia sp.]